MAAGVLVLNADMSPLEFVDWERAVTLLLSVDPEGLPQAIMFEAQPGKTVNSPSMSIAMPRVIQLTRYTYVPWEVRAHGDLSAFATKKDILDRDRRTCAYCGNPGNTIDHVFPRSRGGGDSWENQVASCHRCNNTKADRTPEEAGMRLLWTPWRPDKAGLIARQIWDAAATA